jgi:hypothetical protein
MTGQARAELIAMVGRFQDALVAHDPGRLPLASGARYTEDGQALEPGDGFWGTASEVGRYRCCIADVDSGNVGFFVTMRENGAPVILVGRLKVLDGEVAEIETFLARSSSGIGAMAKGPDLLDERGAPDPEWERIVPSTERLSREALIAAADKYFWGLEKNDGRKDYSFFADDCRRFENGAQTTLNPALRYGEGLGERPTQTQDILANFAGMSAREQFGTGYFCFVDRIRDRRFPVVDVERGAVFSFAFFDHSGTVREIPLTDGRVVPCGVREPFTWQIGEAFKIDRGRISFIEAVMKRCPYGMPPNWPA